SPPKKIDTVLLNGCECEPFLTCDEKLMQEHPQEIINGLKIIMYILSVYNAYVVIEDNKPEAIKAMSKVAFKEPNISVKVVKTKYPEGAEKQLIKAVLGRIIPSGKLPFEVGVVVHNVATSYAIYQAVIEGIPLVKRVVTVTGDSIKFKGNYNVRLGTLVSDLLAECGYIPGPRQKVIHGGPIMGIAQYSLDVPIIKGTSGIVVIDNIDSLADEHQSCVRCGRCIDACPMDLLPNFISIYAENNQFEKAKEYFPLDCIECGCCAYVCIAKRPLVQHIKLAKIQIKSDS
ncbi:MAG: RnfABCDGE type electron transport complex subunit C, partial [Elusimicrobiota bacterium]|nr:RnfABCDGE type electron transport complex subunit C [Elusimicrobiota bacterium]